jgi:hypothetical protein
VIQGLAVAFQKNNSLITMLFSSLWMLIKLASNVNTVRSGLRLSRLSFVSDVVMEFSLLLGSTVSIRKSLIGAKNLFITTGHGFW